jgi:hypothetical protein
MVIADIITRLNFVIEMFNILPFEVLNSPYLYKYMSPTNVNNLKQCIYNQSFIFNAVKISLFNLIKQSGKVDYQKGGNPYQMMFRIFVIIILLAAKTVTSSNELVVNSKNNAPSYDFSSQVVEYTITNVVEIPGAKNTPILFGLTYKNQLNLDLTKLFQETQRNVHSLLRNIRSKCLTHVKRNKESVHTQYINLPDGSQEIDSVVSSPTTYDKDTQIASCFEINPFPFNFNQDTGNIEFIHVNMPLEQVTTILYGILGDMDSVIKDTTKPKPNKEFIEAYNGILIIADGLEKIRELLFDIFSPIVFNPNMRDEYRLESLTDSFNAIILEMTKMKNLLDLKNPYEQMEANSKLEYANEKLKNEETIALARQMSREAENLISKQNVEDTNSYYGNKFDEYMAPASALGNKALEVPVGAVRAMSDAAVDIVFAPVNSVLKGAKQTIMNNKFIAALLAIGVFVTGVITIKIAKNKLTIIYKVGNVIKKILCSPITIPIYIGKRILGYEETVEETPAPVNQQPLIENGPAVTPALIENGPAVTNQPLTEELNERELRKLKRSVMKKLVGNASGTRKRIAKKNTKKKLKPRIKKPSRKPRK